MTGTDAGTGGDGRIGALDGLRAFAVAAVLAFHAGQPWARGGYLGVDAFFVLSGFLITRLLLAERTSTGRVDLAAFWARRVGRLVPALLAVVVVVVSVEAIRGSETLGALRADAAAALLYVSNWRFLDVGQGYFGETAAPSLLQHTWSLAIEEQYYLVWPIVVLACCRVRRASPLVVAAVAGAGAAASAGLMAASAVAGADPARLYFATDVRVQAILVGSTLAALVADGRAADWLARSRPARAASHVIAGAGLATTAVLWWRLDGTSSFLFRGGASLAAVASVAVLPSAALVPGGPVARVLALRPLRATGAISYPLYLWHWPVQLWLTGSATGLRGGPLLALRLAVTLVAATASHFLLEVPIRRRRPLPIARLVVFGNAAVGTAAAVALVASLASPDHDLEPIVVAAAPATTTEVAPVETTAAVALAAPSTQLFAAPTTTTTRAPRTTTTTSPPLTPTYKAEVLGDSVAQSVAQGLGAVQRPYGLRIYDHGILGCGVAPTGAYRMAGQEKDLAGECRRWEETWSARVRSTRPDVVLVQVGRHEVLDRQVEGEWTDILHADLAAAVADGLDRAITVAASSGAAVVLLTAPYYRTGESPSGTPWPENDVRRVDRFNKLARDAAARHPGTVVAELGARTNPGGRYARSVDGVPMRKDGVHYTAEACRWFAPWLVPQVRGAAGRR